MSEPAIDIANIVAYLQLLGIQRHDCATALEFLQAKTLLRLVGIHIGHHDGIRVATLLLGECASMFPES